jgi:chromosome partitioning protein
MMGPFANQKLNEDLSYSGKGYSDRICFIQIRCSKCHREHIQDGQGMLLHDNSMARCKGCGHTFRIKSNIRNKFELQDIKHIARTIGVCISKGGVGKTTTAVNLSAGLARAGFKVLLIDTDTQGQDSYALGIEQPKMGLREFLIDKSSINEASVMARENLWLLAGGKSLAGVKRLIDQQIFGGEMFLAKALMPLENSFDYIIIDTSPGWDPIAINILFYVKEVLSPISLNVMSVHGFIGFLKSLSSIKKYRKDISLKYILPTFSDNNVSSQKKILNKLKQLYGERLCNPVRNDPILAKSPAYGQTIFEYAPGSDGAIDYNELIHRVASDNEFKKMAASRHFI